MEEVVHDEIRGGGVNEEKVVGEVRGGGEDGGGGWGVYHTQAADSGAFGMFQSCIKGKVIKRFLPPILVFTEITHLGLLLSR